MPVKLHACLKRAVFCLVLVFFCGNWVARAEQLSGCQVQRYPGANVIFIILDALRPDRLSCYGNPVRTSPHIDGLARRGVIFTQAFSQSHLTLPSVTSIFSSLYPCVHQSQLIFRDSFPEKTTTLAETLNIHGYRTAWFGYLQDPHSGAAPGLLKGFVEGIEIKPERIFSWIEKNGDKPFFVTIHSYSTHEKDFISKKFENQLFKKIPKSFLKTLEDVRIKGWEGFQGDLRSKRPDLYDFLGEDWIEENWELLMRPFSKETYDKLMYLGHSQQKLYMLEAVTGGTEKAFASSGREGTKAFLRFLDSALFDVDNNLIAGLIAQLKKQGLYHNTLVVITADHGNEFFEHGRLGHLGPLFDESVHVPLIISLPSFRKGLVIDELAQSIDIFPTIISLLDIPVPAQAQGISLAGIISGCPDPAKHEYVHGQSVNDLFYIRSKEWKLILPIESALKNTDEGGMLFHLTDDPRETSNLIQSAPDIAGLLRTKIRREFKLDILEQR